MTWLQTCWHRSSFIRLAMRGVVLALVALPLMLLALKLQPHMPVLSQPMAVVIVTGFALIEATLFIAIKSLFRHVH
jgi:hypothetical protein